jgi:hypothetical protein
MRWRAVWVVVAMCTSACIGHPVDGAQAMGGTVAVLFTVHPPTTPGLQLAGNMDLLGLEHLDLFGDVSAAPQAVVVGASLDPSSTEVQTVRFSDLPQGIYSQLEIDIEHVRIDGTFQDAPLHVQFDVEGLRVDLRASPPPELLPGDTVKLPVAVDADSWWSGVDFSQAKMDNGEILIDLYHNEQMAQAISRALASCFTLGTPLH